MTTSSQHGRALRRSAGLAMVCAGLTLGLVACGDDDDGDAADNAFCTAGPAVDAALSPDEPDPEAVRKALADAEAAVPEELEDEVKMAADAVREAFETQNFDVFETEEFTDANEAINDYYVSECDFEDVDLTARDYAFDGVPDEIDAGPAVLRLENKGEELHEAIILRRNDDAGMPFDEILQLPEDEAQTKVEVIGRGFAFPGSSQGTTMRLTPGEYAVVCFIPKGLTPEAAAEAEESGEEPEGEPHFLLGMVSEFTVED